jgi:hypothetical protein
MKSQDFEKLREDTMYHAIKAQQFAAQLDTDANTAASARAWFALADRLFEALDQSDNMRQVITPTKA